MKLQSVKVFQGDTMVASRKKVVGLIPTQAFSAWIILLVRSDEVQVQKI